MKGRKPKPSYLRVLDGNASHRPMNTQEPKPTGALIDPPESLSDRQKEIWAAALRMSPPDLLRRLDESIFKIWVVAYDYHDQANSMVGKYGVFVKAPKTGTAMQSPWVHVVNRQAQIMMKAAAEMGFTPSARSRVKVDSTPPQGKFTELKELGE